MASIKVAPKRPYKVVGTRPIRHDGVDKVTGKALYGADIHLPGLLYGAVLRSPYAHARIKSIDISRAEAHLDVMAVAVSTDIKDEAPIGQEVVQGKMPAANILAKDKVLYKGHPVAAVAAVNAHVAEQALSLIKVEYEALPSVSSVEEAMKPGAPILHEHWTPVDLLADGSPGNANVTAHDKYTNGDLDSGFQHADLVLEREFRTKSVHQGYIEPQNATAWWAPDDHLTIWCSSQGHFGIRDNTAKILGLPVSNVKVIPMEIGGGFGGKLAVYLEPVAAVLSRKSGRPVKLTMSRAEVLEATGPTCGSYVKMKIGVTKAGQITAAHAFLFFEAGAFPGAPLPGASAAVFAPYKIENVQIDGYDVVVNKPKTAAYRAPGAPIGAYATETVIDEIAEQLQMDPIDLRLLNVAKEGDRRADGVMNGVIGAQETMEALKSHSHYTSPKEGKYVGRGVGMGFCRNNTGIACAVANVLSDGTVSLIEGSVDIGGTRTAIAQQFAEILGLPIEDVNPSIGDTDTIGFTSPTGGSGAVFKSGFAAIEAAEDIKRQLLQRAARIWEVPEDQIEYTDGMLQHSLDPELKMSFKEVASMLPDTGGPIVGRANMNPGGSGGSYAANIIDVEVDPETGKIEILRCTAFQDAGTAIHPSYVEGQIQGGTAQGIGWALNEEYFIDDQGRMMNTSLLDYRMPTSLDLPMIDAVIVEVPNPGHPFGVRGVGEANIVPTLGALANAVYDAVGIRMTKLPMSPAAVTKALHDHKGA